MIRPVSSQPREGDSAQPSDASVKIGVPITYILLRPIWSARPLIAGMEQASARRNAVATQTASDGLTRRSRESWGRATLTIEVSRFAMIIVTRRETRARLRRPTGMSTTVSAEPTGATTGAESFTVAILSASSECPLSAVRVAGERTNPARAHEARTGFGYCGSLVDLHLLYRRRTGREVDVTRIDRHEARRALR